MKTGNPLDLLITIVYHFVFFRNIEELLLNSTLGTAQKCYLAAQ